MRVVLDSNVVVAAMLSPASTSDRVVRAALSRALTVVVCPRLLDEVREVAGRPKFQRLDGEEVDRVLDGLATGETYADPGEPPTVSATLMTTIWLRWLDLQGSTRSSLATTIYSTLICPASW